MPLFRHFRHYATKREIEAAVVNEEDGIRITLRGAVFLTGQEGALKVALTHSAVPEWATATTSIKLEGDRESVLRALVHRLDRIGYEPATRWLRAKDRWTAR